MASVLRRSWLVVCPLALPFRLFSRVQPAPGIAEAPTPTLDPPTAALTPNLHLPTAALTLTVAVPTAHLPEPPPTPPPTPPLIDDLGERFCLDPDHSVGCQTPLVVKLLDYLYRNPGAPDRTAPLERFQRLSMP